MLATAPSADRTLLLGVLALQLDFVDRGAFVAAATDWVADKSRPFGDLLVARGLSTARLALLESLVAEHLARHGGDPHKSLAAVSGIGSVKEDLDDAAGVDDVFGGAYVTSVDHGASSLPRSASVDDVGVLPR